MADKRLAGSRNYLHIGSLGAELTTGATTLDKFYKITAIGAATAFPAEVGKAAVVGDVFYSKPVITLAIGDKCRPFTLARTGFTTSVTQSAQKEKFEDTVQTDEAKSYQESTKSEITGNIEGYFTNGADCKAILNRFFVLVNDNGAGVRTYEPIVTGYLHFFLGRNETGVIGENEIMQYIPAIVDSLTSDKPMEGLQNFNFAYTAVGSERPSHIYRTITA